jgi:hypothetical protein
MDSFTAKLAAVDEPKNLVTTTTCAASRVNKMKLELL